MAGRKSDFTLPTNTLDELFSTQEERDDAKLSKIRDIPLELIDDFPDHPFKVRDDEDMIQLVESVKERGIITPATVRQKEDGRYELISGHRRKRACELAGFEALRCEVVDLDRDAATVLMVESNYQRSQILPSEKAFAYKMRLEAMNRQGQRSDLTCAPVGHKLDGAKSRDILGDEVGESREQIRRYIRLTNLVPELLDLVDEGKIKMRPAVELSYLDEDNQRAVVDEIDLNQCTPSHDQTIRMRKFFTDGKLTPEVVSAIMGEEKPNQREKIVLRGDKVRNLIPKNIPVSQTEDYVVKALEHYDDMEISGGRAVWKDVLAVYAVKTNTDKDNPQEVATMDESKKQILSDIFWEMNSISSRSESHSETEITETDDGNGNIVQTETTVTKMTLYITVSHKTVEEMADLYGFDAEQREYLAELLKDENNSIWAAVLYGIRYSDNQIVTVALSQVGNVGGQPYWSWYGFGSRVEWCACFVSWCANECGYIDTGVIPKFAGCVNGVQWFKDRGQWIDGSAEPVPGMIIFFDWDNKGHSGPQDGQSDHVGIVQKVENGIVYTVEGNSGDSCRVNQYSVGHYEILGYGVPQY